jgi:hypothetical protein
MLLKYELLGLAVLCVVWTIYKAVMNWTDRRTERKLQALNKSLNKNFPTLPDEANCCRLPHT